MQKVTLKKGHSAARHSSILCLNFTTTHSASVVPQPTTEKLPW